MTALNSRNASFLSVDVTLAEGLFERMRGLMGRPEMKNGEALWIRPCKGIHTFGMKFPIDVLFLDGENAVIRINENVRPYRFAPLVLGAKSVLELPSGTVSATATRVGDTVWFDEGALPS